MFYFKFRLIFSIRQFLAFHVLTLQSFLVNNDWLFDIIEDITSHFLIQVQSLMETVKQMDSALQRRTKANTKTINSSIGMISDSEKIAMQVDLDVKSFGQEIIMIFNSQNQNESQLLKLTSYQGLIEIVSFVIKSFRELEK